MLTWDDKRAPLPPSFLSWLCMLSMTPYGVAYPLGQLGWVVPAVSPPSFPLRGTPSLLAGGVQWGAEKTLAPCKHCSTTTKRCLSHQHYFQHKHRKRITTGAVIKKINSSTSTSSTHINIQALVLRELFLQSKWSLTYWWIQTCKYISKSAEKSSLLTTTPDFMLPILKSDFSSHLPPTPQLHHLFLSVFKIEGLYSYTE